MSYIFVMLTRHSAQFHAATRTHRTHPISSCRTFLRRKYGLVRAVMTPDEVDRFKVWAQGVEGWKEGALCPVIFEPLEWHRVQINSSTWHHTPRYDPGIVETVDGLYKLENTPLAYEHCARLGLPIGPLHKTAGEFPLVYETLEEAKTGLVKLYNAPPTPESLTIVHVKSRKPKRP